MKKSNAIEAAEAIASLKHQMPIILDSLSARAEIYHTYYKQLVSEGFTESQALEILKARGLD